MEPPIEDKGKEYTVLVPHVDADGNDVPGIRGPELEVPLATYTGWNFRPQGAAEKAMAAVNGSYLPFAKTRTERLEKGDPRPSIEERYGSRARYVKLVALASQRLVERASYPGRGRRPIREVGDGRARLRRNWLACA